MQNSSGTSKYSTEVDSDILNLSESCVRSDIAEIISKMYTPRSDVPKSGGTSYEGFETRQSAVSREVFLKMDDEPSKRIGIFRETITRNDIRSMVSNTSDKDSSMSDSVSLPIVENVMKSTRKRCAYYCECCRRSLANKNSQNRAKRACRRCCYCHQNRCVDAAELLPQSKVHPSLDFYNPLVGTGQGDFGSNERFIKTNVESVKEASKLALMAPKCSQCSLTRKCSKSQPIKGVIEDENVLQFAPNNEIDESNKNSTLPKSIDAVTKTKSKTLLRRFITSWHVIFQKSHDVGSTHALRNTDNLQIAIPTDQKEEPTSTCLCQKGSNKKSLSKMALAQRENVKPSHVDLEKHELECEEKHQGRDREWNSEVEKSHSKKHIGENDEVTNKNIKPLNETNDKEDLNCEQKRHSKVDIHKNSHLSPSYPLYHGGFYCYDYETSKYYWKATPCPIIRETAVSKNEDWASKFWAEIFGPCRTVTAFFTAFFLELLRFVLSGVVYPLLWKTVESASDFFFRPCLSTLFVSVIQPVLLLFQSIATAIRDVCFPISQCFGNFFAEVADLCRACRLVEVNRISNTYGNQLNP